MTTVGDDDIDGSGSFRPNLAVAQRRFSNELGVWAGRGSGFHATTRTGGNPPCPQERCRPAKPVCCLSGHVIIFG